MKIGIVGLGKLGTPVAHVFASAGHHVIGYDTDPERMDAGRPHPEREAGVRSEVGTFEEFRADYPINYGSTMAAMADRQIVFVAVQTPHDRRFEGDRVVPADQSADFDYGPLVACLNELLPHLHPDALLVLISTVAPGTHARIIRPLIADRPYAYNPSFIAMGTVVPDMLNPEFVLIGSDDEHAIAWLNDFYRTVHMAPVRGMSLASAEVTKMAYNTFIGLKIVFANSVMELCEVCDGDCGDVMSALLSATGRIISGRYLTPGMGDGGGCHPRDNLVLSHLAKASGRADLAGAVMRLREEQARWLCQIVAGIAMMAKLPIIVLGRAFKTETNLETGSSAVLCLNMLAEMVKTGGVPAVNVTSYEPASDPPMQIGGPAVFLVGVRRPEFADYEFPPTSVIVDPHRYIPDRPGCKVIRLGQGPTRKV